MTNSSSSKRGRLFNRKKMSRRAVKAWVLFTLIQAIIAVIITWRARVAEHRRSGRRGIRVPARSFPEVKLEHCNGRVKVFMEGYELFDDIIASIDQAKKEVFVETYIWHDDEVGARVRDALVRAAGRGVNVRVLWDWLQTSRSVNEDYFTRAIEAYPFKPLGVNLGSLHPRNALRDHRKVIIIDGELAYVGGFNIGKQFINWRDTHIRVDGAAAREVANAFVDFWNQQAPAGATRLDDVPNRPWDPHVLVHRNDPSLAIFPIRGMYMEAIDRSEERVWITTAYFIPDRAFRDALTAAARRGVDVRLIVPKRSNHAITDVLAHGVFQELLDAGVRIFLYRDFMVHSKTAVIDHTWATVGTANLDRWSMLGNYEINVEVRSEELAKQMAEMFEFDLKQCDEVLIAAWRRRPLLWRIAERFLRNLAPIM